MKILVAEDNSTSMILLKKTLEKWGYEVLTAEDGIKAWNMFQYNHVDIVITDWMMPEMDGIELCKKIREHNTNRYIYIIILTAREETKDLVEGFEAGADDFLTKPYNRDELKSRLMVGIRILELENTLHEKNQLLEDANSRIIDDLRYAAKIQKSLLPNNLPDIKGVDICWKFSPCAQLGGDMLNVLRLDENCYGVYVLDVSGHGIPAALFSVALSRLLSEHRDILKSSIQDPPYYRISPPKEVLKSLNSQFPMDSNTEQYFTIVYGIIDMSKRTFHWSCAGHPSPITLDDDGAKIHTDVGGPPIGFFENAQYTGGVMKFKPNQRIILCSDGILEAMNELDQQFTIDRMKRILEDTRNLRLKELLSHLITEVRQWTQKRGGPYDDITLLGLDISEA